MDKSTILTSIVLVCRIYYTEWT